MERTTVEFKVFSNFGKCAIVKEVGKKNKVRFFAVDMYAKVVGEGSTQKELEDKLNERN